MWSAVSGKFHSVLEGPLEKVVDLVWHPHLNVLATVAAGKVRLGLWDMAPVQGLVLGL